jgi:glycosyltransferase involved in cell wall biosynthesis
MVVSVVIPVYNEEDYIKACLDAIARQTRLPDAVYVIDNNSTDDSMAIARTFPFVTILQQPVQGICASAKTGLDVAAENGGLILRLDADCRPYQNWIKDISKVFEHDSSIVAVTGPGRAYDAGLVLSFLINWAYMKPYFLFVGLALGQKPLFGSNFAIRADSWRNISPTTHLAAYQNIHDDIDISYHVIKEGRIAYRNRIYMPMSARPLRASLPKVITRYNAGFRSIFIHWPQQAPWKR